MKRPKYHIILRYSDKQAPPPGTIRLHEEVIKRHGSVWLGKFGRRLRDQVFALLKRQIKAKETTYIFLTRSGKESVLCAGLLEDMERKVDDYDLIPQYYHDKAHGVSTWFNISRFIELSPKMLTVLIGKSSGVPISMTMSLSMAATFLVTLKEDEKLDYYVVDKVSS